MTKRFALLCGVLTTVFWLAPAGIAQQAAPPETPGAAPAAQAPPAVSPPPQGRTKDIEVVRDFDRDGNGWLNLEERSAARARVAELRAASVRPAGSRRVPRRLPRRPSPRRPRSQAAA